MHYRRLGQSGLQVSELSLGSWVTYHKQVDVPAATAMIGTALDAGVNFFDNAEAYAGGESEVVMGLALKALNRPRLSYIVSSKYFWGLPPRSDLREATTVNQKDTLNRKYLMQAIDGSLERFGLDFIDLVYCHRPDPNTPIEETVRAMNDIIHQGKALYWGTSEWAATDIREAWQLADKHGWHKPVVEQPQYHLFHRRRVEREYSRLYRSIGLGLTTWSPLASGLLTGKYQDGIPPDSRGAMPTMNFLVKDLTDPAKRAAVGRLAAIASDLGCTVAQLAIAWCAKNPNVSSVITGASQLAQLQGNLGAVDVIPKLTAEVMRQIDAISAPLAA